MVVPLGVVTASFSMAGCSPVSTTIAPAPRTVCAASLSATSRGRPILTPPSASASMTMYRNAGPLADRPVTASMWRSSSTSVWPTAPNICSARARSLVDAREPPASAVMPSRTSAGVFGMARTTGTRAFRCFSMTAVLTDDAAEINSCVVLSSGPTSRSTGTTCCGLTTSSTTCAPCTASALEAAARTPSRRARSRERALCSVVTVTERASVRPASIMPRMSVSPSCPAPRTARRRRARERGRGVGVRRAAMRGSRVRVGP